MSRATKAYDGDGLEVMAVAWWDTEVLFGLSIENILNFVLLALIVVGLVYSIFFRSKDEAD